MGPADEIVLNQAFDPTAAHDLLPPGIRLRTLEEIARRTDSAAIAGYLRAHPEHKGWAYGFFEIIRPARLEYDGYAARLGARGGMAVWYAYAARTDWAPRAISQTFEIVTFYGHVQHECADAVWEVGGAASLAKALRGRAAGGPEMSGTDYYAHYVLRGALYRR